MAPEVPGRAGRGDLIWRVALVAVMLMFGVLLGIAYAAMFGAW